MGNVSLNGEVNPCNISESERNEDLKNSMENIQIKDLKGKKEGD